MMSPTTILYIILGIFIFSSLLSQILEFLNLKHHKKELPDLLKDKLDAAQYEKAYKYHKTRYRFSFLRSSISFFVVGAILAFGYFGFLDDWLQQFSTHPIWMPLIFFGVLFFASDIVSIPFQLYSTFVIEEKFGFNKTKPATFFTDKIKSYLLTIILGGLIMGILLWLINTLGANFWIWFWMVATAFTVVMSMFYTSILLPIFNKLSPLQEGELRTSIETYSQQVQFPLDNIFVIDGSKRSTKANAFFSGLGKRKRIVLYDTLIENHSKEELVAVLAHEVGHYKKKHTRQGLIISIIQTGLTLFILSLFVNSTTLSEALGGAAGESLIHLNLIAFGILYSPISMVVGIGMNMLSRKNEFEADKYAADTYSGNALQEALIKLHADNLSNLTPHPLYVFLNYSHPPLLQRIAALPIS